MVYLLVELFNYRQLARLRRDTLPGIEKRLAELYGGRKTRVLKIREGIALVECGREEGLDVRACASLGLQIHDFLKSMHEELFGFTVLIATFPAEDVARVESGIKELVSTVDREEELWLSEGAAVLFREYLTVSPEGEIRRVIAARQEELRGTDEEERSPIWVRENLVQRALDAITPRLNGEEEGRVLYLYGPAGAGKTSVLREAARRLGAGDERAPLLRMYTLFRRRSPLHPFINSLSPALLAEVPRFLQGPEPAVWEEVGGLLCRLHGAEVSSGDELGPFFPDRILEDFAIGYRLYLLAFIRMTAAKLLPAFLSCEGIESYHPAARRTAAQIISEMLGHHTFIPVLSSTSEAVPEEFSGMAVAPLCVHPLGKREVRSLSRHLFPGLEIPEAEVRRIRRRAGGLYIPVASYLQYLSKTGKIANDNGRFAWIQSMDEEAVLPSNPISVSWFLIRSLADDSFLLLYALYLAAGLLDRSGLFRFLSRAGFDDAAVERSLAGLIASGLVTEEEFLVPRVAALRRKLEELLGREAEKLRADFTAYLFSLWKKGDYPRRVLLFSFLARSGRTDLALQVLPDIIRRKVEERDLAGAKAFSDAARLEFSTPVDARQKGDLLLIAAVGKLRASLLEGKISEAANHFRVLSRSQKSTAKGEPAGDAALARALYSLACGEGAPALEELKTALLSFQETGFDRGERAAYHLLGVTLLGDGKTSEAIEYLGLSERLCVEAGDPLGALRSASFLPVGLFLEGRLTHCLSKAEQGEEMARSLGQREQELFLRFTRAKALFQLGSYKECALHIQRCLCLAVLYSRGQARAVLSSWLARALLYAGEIESATRLLGQLEPRREVLFFLAEAAFFANDLEKASGFVEDALKQGEAPPFPPPEGVSWKDGFSSVEGRCFRFSRDDALLRRSIRSLEGCLLGLRGFMREAVHELHRLTRGEDSAEEDPNAFLYAYLYSLVLPEFATEEGDDKTTILSKSLKGLQERASRIESPVHKTAFLGLNYWNRRIMEDSRQRKLI